MWAKSDCICSNRASARVRSSMSVSRTYQRAMRPESSRTGTPRLSNHRYSPSKRRRRSSKWKGIPEAIALLKSSRTRGRSSGCTASFVPQFFSHSSDRPKYSRTWRLTVSSSPFGAMTATRPAIPSIAERALRSLSRSASCARMIAVTSVPVPR